MRYNRLKHKRMWVEKLENDLAQLPKLGYDKKTYLYQEALNRTKKAQRELSILER